MIRMLVVEDDSLSQNLMERIFKKDYELDICESSDEYSEKYAGIKYSIMVIDVSIKGTKYGLELIKEIRNSSLNKETPIICMTAHAQNSLKCAALESGADLFITKPVSIKALREAVISLLNQ